MTSKAPAYLNQTPALTITADEVEDLLKPYVFEISGEVYALKSTDAFTVEDYGTIIDDATEDLVTVIDTIAFDERSSKALRTVGITIMRRVFEGWVASQGVGPGESESSDD